MLLQRLWHCGEAIARQIGKQRAGAKPEEIDLLRATRRLARERETRLVRERVDRTRLACIRSSGERDLRQIGGRPTDAGLRVGGGEQELGLSDAHARIVRYPPRP